MSVTNGAFASLIQSIKHRNHSQEERCEETFLQSEEDAQTLLAEQGYIMIVRIQHIHAQKALGPSHDERHVCRLDELPLLSRSSFCHLVESIFQAKGHCDTPSTHFVE